MGCGCVAPTEGGTACAGGVCKPLQTTVSLAFGATFGSVSQPDERTGEPPHWRAVEEATGRDARGGVGGRVETVDRRLITQPCGVSVCGE